MKNLCCPGAFTTRRAAMLCAFFSVLAVFPLFAFAAQNDPDPTFNASVYAPPPSMGNINVIKQQPDGKVLAAGYFAVVDGVPRSGLVRFNSDGTVDPSCVPPDIHSSSVGLGGIIYSIALQSDGKILVGGEIIGVNQTALSGLKRYNQDCTLDATFVNLQAIVVNDIAVLPNDMIVVGGFGPNLVRLSPNGTRDQSFAPP
jgi:uncharacterized delta-60 repeat protein